MLVLGAPDEEPSSMAADQIFGYGPETNRPRVLSILSCSRNSLARKAVCLSRMGLDSRPRTHSGVSCRIALAVREMGVS
jgi:hypothetical protein